MFCCHNTTFVLHINIKYSLIYCVTALYDTYSIYSQQSALFRRIVHKLPIDLVIERLVNENTLKGIAFNSLSNSFSNITKLHNNVKYFVYFDIPQLKKTNEDVTNKCHILT